MTTSSDKLITLINKLMKQAFRTEFVNLPSHVNWYPGHMRKAYRTIGPELKKVSLFIEVRDSRLPLTSHNSELDVKLKEFKVSKAVVFSKFDLCDESQTMKIIKQLKLENPDTTFLHMSNKSGQNVNKLVNTIKDKFQTEFRSLGGWLMIGGVPNVGKSSLINSIRKRDSELNHTKKTGARTGGIPCITKSMTGFKVLSEPLTYMIDTPGIIMPKIEPDSDQGLKLQACNIIRDGIIEDSLVCDYLLFRLNKAKLSKFYQKRYNLAAPLENFDELQKQIHLRIGKAEEMAALRVFLEDFREGRLGKLTLD